MEDLIKFAERRFGEKRLKPIVFQGLKTYMKFPGLFSASFYLFDDETLEFEPVANLPEDRNPDEILKNAFDKGLLTNALQSNSAVFDSFGRKQYSMAVFALQSINKVLAVVILEFNVNEKEIKINEYRSLLLISFFLGSSVNEFLLHENKLKFQDMMDQFVAARTMDIEKSKQSLGDKIEHITKNLMLSIPHEVRTPINQILGFTKFLRDYYIKEEIEDYEDISEIVEDINSSTLRLKRLFENYIYFANLTILSNDLKQLELLRNEATHSIASEIFERALSKAYMAERKDDLEVHTVDASVSIGETYLIKIIDELMDNSLKYSEPGTKIKLSSRIDDEHYYLTIRDNGIGLYEEQIKKDRRVRSIRPRQNGATGPRPGIGHHHEDPQPAPRRPCHHKPQRPFYRSYGQAPPGKRYGKIINFLIL